MDYISESILFEYAELTESNNRLFEQMHGEIKLLLESENTLNVLLEAEGNKTGVIKRIVEFIKRIISKFTDKANLISGNNVKFIKNNEKLLDSADIQKINLKLTPYWKQKQTSQVFNEVSNKIDSVVKSKNKDGLDMEKLKKLVAPQYLNPDGNLTTGLNNYFRTGDTNKSELKISVDGSELRKIVNNYMVPFVKDYKTKALPEVKEINRKVTALLGIAEREQGNRIAMGNDDSDKNADVKVEVKPTKESDISLSLLGVPLTGSEFGAFHDIHILKEAQEKPSNTKVEAEKFKDSQEERVNSQIKKSDNDTIKIYVNCMKILQNVAATIMTILEEKNITYMNALKAIVSSLKSGGDDTSDKLSSAKVDRSI